jgi:uncharacterized protein with ParB-like and HNH nuclease domain
MSFIDANEINLQKFLNQPNEIFKLPLYQRPYAWTKDQWADLLEDVLSLPKDDSHFFGAIVVVPSEVPIQGFNSFYVIDGQQRLATMLIWLSVIRDQMKEKNVGLAKFISDSFLFSNAFYNGKQTFLPKFELGEYDNKHIKNILEGNVKETEHSIYRCYEFYKNAQYPDDIWTILLNNIYIVHINAHNYFNAFKLFETLNDRGLELSAADLIKNYLLMSTSFNKDIFKNCINEWEEMYQKVRDKSPVKFIRRYILSSYKGVVSENNLYKYVRSRLENNKPELNLQFAINLNSSASIYKKIFESSFNDNTINKRLNDLKTIEVSPSFTLLINILPLYEEGEIEKNIILDIFGMIEAFHIRWGICGQSTNRLDHIYNEICNGLEQKNPVDYKKYIEGKLSKYVQEYVGDESFRRNFASRNFKFGEQRTKYILWKLDDPTGETILDINEVETEHIMPQTLSDQWIKYIKSKTGLDQNEIFSLQENWINNIGNLTIIKGNWNRSMSNRLFEKKKEDYIKSTFRITKELSYVDNWLFEDIEDRSKKFAEKALEIWKWEAEPLVEPVKEKIKIGEERKKFWSGLLEISNKNIRYHSNCRPGINTSITGGSGIRGIVYYYSITLNYGSIGVYLDRGNKTENKFIFDILYKNKESIEQIFNDNLIWDSSPNTRACYILKKYEHIGLEDKENWPSFQSEMVDSMQKLIKAIDTHLDKLAIENKDYEQLVKNKNKWAPGDELRFEFWKSFIERRKKLIGVFGDIYPSTYSFTGKQIDKSGIYYYFSIPNNYGQIRLYIDKGKGKKEENKQIFNSLFRNKQAIEYAFGDELDWDRKDNQRSSEIGKKYDFRTINDRATWSDIQEKMIKGMVRLENVFEKYISEFVRL